MPQADPAVTWSGHRGGQGGMRRTWPARPAVPEPAADGRMRAVGRDAAGQAAQRLQVRAQGPHGRAVARRRRCGAEAGQRHSKRLAHLGRRAEALRTSIPRRLRPMAKQQGVPQTECCCWSAAGSCHIKLGLQPAAARPVGRSVRPGALAGGPRLLGEVAVRVRELPEELRPVRGRPGADGRLEPGRDDHLLPRARARPSAPALARRSLADLQGFPRAFQAWTASSFQGRSRIQPAYPLPAAQAGSRLPQVRPQQQRLEEGCRVGEAQAGHEGGVRGEAAARAAQRLLAAALPARRPGPAKGSGRGVRYLRAEDRGCLRTSAVFLCGCNLTGAQRSPSLEHAAPGAGGCLDEDERVCVDGRQRVHERQVQRARARPPSGRLPPAPPRLAHVQQGVGMRRSVLQRPALGHKQSGVAAA